MSATRATRLSVPLSTILLAALTLDACAPATVAPTERAPVAPTQTRLAEVTPEPEAPAEPTIELDQAVALRLSPNQITYSVRLTNRSESGGGGLTLTMQLPEGATLRKILTHPLHATAESDGVKVTWLVSEVPAKASRAPSHAWWNWRASPGQLRSKQ